MPVARLPCVSWTRPSVTENMVQEQADDGARDGVCRLAPVIRPLHHPVSTRSEE